jgi:hypothetical protein
MRGTILSFDTSRGEGLILTDSGERRRFNQQSWSDRTYQPVEGLNVDFADEGGIARDIFVIRQARPSDTAAPSAAKPSSASDGTLLGGLSVGAAILGLIPAFGVIFSIAALVLGIIARKQAKLTDNSTGKMLGGIGIAAACIIFVIELLGALFGAVMLFGMSR